MEFGKTNKVGDRPTETDKNKTQKKDNYSAFACNKTCKVEPQPSGNSGNEIEKKKQRGESIQMSAPIFSTVTAQNQLTASTSTPPRSNNDPEHHDLQGDFDQLSSTSKQRPAHKKRKAQDTSIDNESLRKKKCLEYLKAIAPQDMNEIITILKAKDSNQDQTRLVHLCNNSWSDAYGIMKYRNFLLQSISPVSASFDPDNFEYMTRPISLQDDDPRMGKTVYEFFVKMTDMNTTHLCQILDIKMCRKPFEAMSYLILNKVYGEMFTLENLHELLKNSKGIFPGLASVIENKKMERLCENPRITNNKTLLHILSKSQKELQNIGNSSLDIGIHLLIIKTITWCVNAAGIKFLLCLFHTICGPKDSCNILEEHKAGKLTLQQAAFKIIEIMKEKERPIGDIFDVVYNLDMLGIMDDVEGWANKIAHLIPES